LNGMADLFPEFSIVNKFRRAVPLRLRNELTFAIWVRLQIFNDDHYDHL